MSQAVKSGVGRFVALSRRGIDKIDGDFSPGIVAWYQLEREADDQWRNTVAEAMLEKMARIAAAQSAGALPSRMDAAELVLAVQAIVRMWFIQPKDVVAVADHDAVERRDAVRTAVEAPIGDVRVDSG